MEIRNPKDLVLLFRQYEFLKYKYHFKDIIRQLLLILRLFQRTETIITKLNVLQDTVPKVQVIQEFLSNLSDVVGDISRRIPIYPLRNEVGHYDRLLNLAGNAFDPRNQPWSTIRLHEAKYQGKKSHGSLTLTLLQYSRIF